MPDPTLNTAAELLKAMPQEHVYLLERFIASLGAHASKQTVRQYTRVTAEYLTFLRTEGIEIAAARPKDIEDFFFERRGLSASSEKNYLSIITSFYDYLIMRDQAEANPATIYRKASKQRFKRAPEPKRNLVNEAQFQALLEARRAWAAHAGTPSPILERDLAILHLFFGSGLRREEIFSLNVGSFDANQGAIRVRGKGGKERNIAVLVQSEEVLKGYLRTIRPLFNPGANEQALFLSETDGGACARMTYDQIGYMVRKVIKSSGLFSSGDGGTHLLRRSHATMVQRQTGNPKLVQSQLGHASITTTDIYIKLAGSEQNEEVRDKVGYDKE